MLKTVRGKLLLAFTTLVAFVAIVAGIGLVGMSHGQADYDYYVGHTGKRLALAHDVLNAANARAIAARNMVLIATAADIKAEHQAVLAAHRAVGESMKALAATFEGGLDDGDERAEFRKLEEAESRYGPVALDIVAQAVGGNSAVAIDRIDTECRALLASLVAQTTKFIDATQAAAERAEAAARARQNVDRNLAISVLVVAVLAAGAISTAILRSVDRDLGAEPSALNAIVRTIAAGDLAAPHEAERASSGSTLAAVRAMTESLATTVAAVRENAEHVATASAQIAQGNQDLSDRTEKQASALEETAATMDELAATVAQNAANAREASTLAAQASQLAHAGGDAVGEVVQTMRDIESGSSKIGEITSVIDNIAFQTNILALNAAVEAARAGEQGRGFAVVASEVRSLARRSGEAAKEIKALIDGSTAQVALGRSQVDAAGARMTEIVESIGRVNEIVSAISTASAEQAAGVSQVGQAIAQMDQATQQNAALVEESSAAAASLREQAQQLVSAVAQFRT